MSRRRQQANPCPTATKTAFSTKELAEEVLVRIRSGYSRPERDAGGSVPARVYLCSCGRWHLTSKAVDWSAAS